MRPRRARRAPVEASLAVLGLLAGVRAEGAFLREFPRPAVAVEFHPRGDRPFTTGQLDRVLRLGVHAVELDLRWRAADSRVVCAHRRQDVARAPSLEDALDAIVRHRGTSPTVQRDGLQFFVVLDLKDETADFHHAVVRALAGRAGIWSTAARPPGSPRGITVVVSGFRAAFERSVPRAGLDTLCIVEGRTYGARIQNLSGGDGRFQWIALEAPVERARVRSLHEGRDPALRGRFNVRIVAAHGMLRRAITSGADAVNADEDELEGALRAAARVRAGRLR